MEKKNLVQQNRKYLYSSAESAWIVIIFLSLHSWKWQAFKPLSASVLSFFPLDLWEETHHTELCIFFEDQGLGIH